MYIALAILFLLAVGVIGHAIWTAEHIKPQD